MRSRVLFATGHRDDAHRLSHMLRHLPVAIDHVGTISQVRSQLQSEDYEVVLTEASLPDGTWLDVLHLARAIPREVEVIVTDPQADARFWAEALNLGAYDLLAQPFYEPEVQRILGNACTRSTNYSHAAV
jgi:DNA-binding NtrC family response regulator